MWSVGTAGVRDLAPDDFSILHDHDAVAHLAASCIDSQQYAELVPTEQNIVGVTDHLDPDDGHAVRFRTERWKTGQCIDTLASDPIRDAADAVHVFDQVMGGDEHQQTFVGKDVAHVLHGVSHPDHGACFEGEGVEMEGDLAVGGGK